MVIVKRIMNSTIILLCLEILSLFIVLQAQTRAKLNFYGDYGEVEQNEAVRDKVGININNDPFGYSDEYTDSESGLQYLKARYYNPRIMRFTAMDTDPLLNRYNYANANPVMNDDPSGHSAISQGLGISGSAIGIGDSSFALVNALTMSDPITASCEVLSSMLGLTAMASGILANSDSQLSTGEKIFLGGYSLLAGVLAGGVAEGARRYYNNSDEVIATRIYGDGTKPDARGGYGAVYFDRDNTMALKIYLNDQEAKAQSERAVGFWNHYFKYMGDTLGLSELSDLASARAVVIKDSQGNPLYGMLTPYIEGSGNTLDGLSPENLEYLRVNNQYMMVDDGIPGNFKMIDVKGRKIQVLIDSDDILDSNSQSESVMSAKRWKQPGRARSILESTRKRYYNSFDPINSNNLNGEQ